MALPFVSLRGGKHLFKGGAKRVSRGKGRAVIIDESGGMRAVVRNIETGNEYVIVPPPRNRRQPRRRCSSAKGSSRRSRAPACATGTKNRRRTPSNTWPGFWWLRPSVRGRELVQGTQGSAAPIPQQVAKQLSGTRFESLREFREAFWKAVAKDPNLSRGWTDENLGEMAAGRAPWAPKDQHAAGHVKYILHHKTPISQGGGVYDLDNIMVVTPRYHSEVLDSKYHGGG